MNDGREVSQFTWLGRNRVLGMAGSLTLTENAQLAQVQERFGETVEHQGSMRLADLPMHDPAGPFLVALASLEGWVLAVEVNGWQGARPEVLCRLAELGSAANLRWTTTSSPRFSYATRGEIVTSFEYAAPDRRVGLDPDAVESARDGLPWPPDAQAESVDPLSVMLALIARVTGLTPTPDWLAATFEVVSVQPWPEGLRSQILPETQPLTYQEPPLVWALLHAPTPLLRQATRLAVQHATTATDLTSRPPIAAALADPAATIDSALAKLSNTALRDARRGKARTMALGSYQAIEAARQLTNPSPMAGAFQAITNARAALAAAHQPMNQLRDELMHLLGDPTPPTGSYNIADPHNPTPDPGTYRWLPEHWLRYAGTLTCATGTDIPTVARALSGQPATGTTEIPHLTREPVLALRTHNDWVFAIDIGETHRVHQQAIEAITNATTVVAVTWSGRNRALLYYASNGSIQAILDPLNPDQPDGENPTALEPHLTDITLPAPANAGALRQVPTLLAIAQKITGIPLLPSMLDHPHQLIPLPGQATI